jgi:hypothetical protein
MPLARRAFSASFLHRSIAAMCAAVIFSLGVFASCPELHERLHDGSAIGADDHCAVEIFASGISVPLGLQTLAPPLECRRIEQPAPRIEICLSSPRFLLQPERGPPAA